MQAEGDAARQGFEAQQDALEQDAAAENAAAEAEAAETAVPDTYADTHLSQGLLGLNQGIANVLGGPVDLVEMGLNGVMAAAEFVGVRETMTPEFSGR